jgi:CO/xanthine dehydrogenase Mo-binding subunit
MKRGMTAEAEAALRGAGLSRRELLKASGALIVGFCIGAPAVRGQVPLSPSLSEVDSWIAIGADGRITAYSGKEELGQGIAVVQQQLVAEELSVPFERVTLLYCDTALTPDQGHTSGSQSHPANFNNENLAQAAATARETLVQMASERLGVPVDQLTAADGVIRSNGDPSLRATYAELLGGRVFNRQVSATARRKPPSEWTVLGQSIPRPDIPALVTGEFEFVHNVKLPGMLHGKVVRPPSPETTLARVDESSIADLSGIVKVVVRRNFVGVVAEKPWQALQAADRLKVEWSPGPPLPDQSSHYEQLRAARPSSDSLLTDSGDVDQKLAVAATIVEATYLHPYQMHGSLGSSCAVADIREGEGTLYSATQGVWYQKYTAGMILGIAPEKLRVVFRRGSGCYGVNGADAATYDAAILSQEVNRPVRVQLSRKDEMAWENYGYAFVLDQRAGLDAEGNITAWDYESWSTSRGGRPGLNQPGNIVTGYLLGFEPDTVESRAAATPRRYNNGQNAIPSYFAARFDGEPRGCGTIDSGRVLTHTVSTPFFTGPLRSPRRLQNTFAHESFMDELAARAGADPVEYRRRHLRDPRLLGVLNAAAERAGWEVRSSPRPNQPTSGTASGRGVANVLYEGDNGYTAVVAEVEVNQDTGAIHVKRIVCSSDCGPISNPDGLINQMEGGALQAMSRTLLEEVTWDEEKVTSFDWIGYKSLPVGFDVPEIESVLINQTEGKAMGAGETSITAVAAAIGNAVFDATGARLREIPFTPARVKAALAARG